MRGGRGCVDMVGEGPIDCRGSLRKLVPGP